MAKPRDVDDHLTWLLERDKFSEALDAAEAQEKQLKDYTVAGIGQRWLAFLIDSAQYDLYVTSCLFFSCLAHIFRSRCTRI